MCDATCDAFFFFFSSRRRHTRLVSDWSSDVCSSDLIWMPLPISIYTCYTHKAKYHYFVFQSVLILRLINFYVQFHFRSVSFNVLHLNMVPILYYGFSRNVFWLRKCFEAYVFFLHCWMLITSNNFIRLLIESYEHFKCKI